MTSFLNLKIRNKRNLFSNYSFVFFIILSITLIFFDLKKIINSSVIRSTIINSTFHTRDFFISNLPNINKLKLLFVSKEELELENKYLREKIEESSLYRLKSEKLEIENNILKQELSLLPAVLEDYILVKVSADTQTQYNKSIIINAGNNMNIKKGDAALTYKGLIGSVIEVYEKYSRVLLISDINSRIPVRIGENNIKAIIAGNNSDKIELLYLKDNVVFKENDLVYTSGDGGYFNSGLPIGLIKRENNAVYIDSLNDLSQIQYINIYVNQFKNF